MNMYELYCKLRDERGLKDATVASGTGIGKSTFSDWKSGRSIPKHDKLQKIADYFGVTIDYLMTGEEKEPVSAKPNTLAAHFEGEEFSEDEMNEIMNFVEFVKGKRK